MIIAEFMKDTDIVITERKEEVHGMPDRHFLRARVHVSAEVELNPHELVRNQKEFTEHAKAHVRRHIEHAIYGRIREAAREAYIKAERLFAMMPHYSYGDAQEFRKSFEPLLNAGPIVTGNAP